MSGDGPGAPLGCTYSAAAGGWTAQVWRRADGKIGAAVAEVGRDGVAFRGSLDLRHPETITSAVCRACPGAEPLEIQSLLAQALEKMRAGGAAIPDPPFQANGNGRAEGTAGTPGGSPPAARGLAVRRASDITPRPIRWHWRRRIAASRYLELVGFPGIGKTAVVMDLIGRLTTDAGWPDGTQGSPCDVVIVAAEDEAEDVLVPRLMVAGTDLSRVHFVDGIRRAPDADLQDLDLSQAIDFLEVSRLAEEVGAGLVYIDALDDVLGAKHDGKGNTETRRALAPVRRLARLTGAAVLGLRHPTKRVGLGPALNQGNGSIAYGAVARGSLLVTLDPINPERRLLLATKSNISRLAETLVFRLESGAADDDAPPKVIWEGADPRGADEVLADLRTQEQADPNEAAAEESKLSQAETALREWLGSGWLPVAELETLSRQRGISPKTLRRAKESLSLQYQREGFGQGSRLLCALPGSGTYTPTPRDKGKYEQRNPGPDPQAGDGERDSGPAHTRPAHTCPSANTRPGASMQKPPEYCSVHQAERLEPSPITGLPVCAACDPQLRPDKYRPSTGRWPADWCPRRSRTPKLRPTIPSRRAGHRAALPPSNSLAGAPDTR
jgi:putative DNA primase/helicase